jgi:isopentenyldiphosphate isomerase
MSEKVYPNITVVDEHDNVLGYMQLFDAIAAGHIRRVVYVVVLNHKNEVILQRRGPHVLNPDLLDCSVSGHVDEGNTYEEAAKRELSEELGIVASALELVCEPFLLPGFFNGVFKAVIDSEVISPARDELSGVGWIKKDEVLHMMEQTPELFTPEFVRIWKRVHDKI